MSDKKISQLPASTTPLGGTEELAVVQSGDTKKVSVANLTTGRSVSMSIANTDLTDAVTDAVSYPIIAAHTTSGSTANGFGTGVSFQQENSVYSVVTETATIETVATDQVSIHTDLIFKTKYNNLLAERVRIKNGSDLAIANGNLVIGTSGKGIDFSADGSAAGMTSELLDDYEEGTWTPTISSAAGVVTLVDASACTYTKIGRLVYIFARVGITTDASVGTSDLTIGGLPFSAYQTSFANLTGSNFSASDFGTGGAHGFVNVESTSLFHRARTVDISSRGSTFYWSYAAVYSV